MNALQMREVLMKVRKGMKCPICSSQISTNNITIVDTVDNDKCSLQMSCDSCSARFGGHAYFQESVTDYGKKMNASTRSGLLKQQDNPISSQELSYMKSVLPQMSNLTDVLKKNNKK